MNWIKIDKKESIAELQELSLNERVFIFKFSPVSSIDHVVRILLEREWAEGEMKMKTYMVDTVSDNVISGEIEKVFGVEHESPQVLIVKDGKTEFYASYGKILYSALRKFANCSR